MIDAFHTFILSCMCETDERTHGRI